MNTHPSELLALLESCIHLIRELTECLKSERMALIHFKLEELVEINSRKEMVLKSLFATRATLRLKKKQHPDETFYACPQWQELLEQWDEAWKESHLLCLTNQKFLEHSVRNIESCLENLKRLLSDSSTYNPVGKRVDSLKQGRMVEAKY